MKIKDLFYIKTFAKKYFFAIVTIVLLIIPLCVTFIYQKRVNNSNQNENRTAMAAQMTPTVTLSLPSIFRDSLNGSVLSIQLSPGRPDTGQFDFTLAQSGDYRGTIPLLQSGTQIIHPQGQVTALFYSLNGGVPVQTDVRMEGEINTVQNKASINVWINNTHYHLETAQPDTALAIATSKKILTLTISQNWSGLYGIFSSQVQATTTQAQFTQLMTSSNSPTVIGAELNGQGQVKVIGGYTYYSQPITLTVRQPDNTTTIFHNRQYFVLEQGAWRLLTTDTPK